MRRALALAIALACASGHALEDVENPELTTRARTILSIPANTPGALIEDTPETVFHWVADNWNRVRFPEALDSSRWGGGPWNSATVTADAEIAPNGTQTADRLTWATGDYSGRCTGYLPVSASTSYVASAYTMAGTTANIEVVVNLYNTGVHLREVAASYSAGSGWQRVQVPTITTTVSENQAQVCVRFATGGDPSKTFYAWGAQLVQGNAALPYKSPPTANLLASPSNLGSTIWQKTGVGGGSPPSVQADPVQAPDGTMTANRVTFAAVPALYSGIVYQAKTVQVGLRTDSSVWLRRQSGTGTVKLNWGTVGEVICSVSSTWSRCVTSAVWDSTSGGFTLGVVGPSDGDVLDVWSPVFTRADQQGDTLVMNGTVPLVTTSPLFANGSGAGRRYVGPYSALNYFSFTNSAVNLTAFTLCVAFMPDTALTASAMFANYDVGAPNGGYALRTLAGGVVFFQWFNGASGTSANSTNTASAGAVNVACGGMAGTTGYVKLNGGTTVSAVQAITTSTSAIAQIGKLINSGVQPMVGTIREVWATSTPWNEASVTQIQANALANGGKGPLFPDDANTVLHLVGDAYDGVTWKAPQATLTTVGTVGYSDAWVPPVAAQLQRAAYGPFTPAATYFQLGTGADVFDFDGDFSVCLVVGLPPPNGYQDILTNDGPGINGYDLHYEPTSSRFVFQSFNPAQNNVYAQGAPNAPNVVCIGRAGTTKLVKANLGSLATANATWPTNADAPLRIGQNTNGTVRYAGTVYEVWASTEPASDALFTKIQTRVLQQLSAHGGAITTTRSSATTYEVLNRSSQVLYYGPANRFAQAPEGIEVWRQSANLAVRSDELDSAPWGSAGVTTVTPNQGAYAGSATMEKIETTGGYAHRDLGVTFGAASTGPWTASGWFAAPTGTVTASLVLNLATGNATSCTCSRSDGGTCTIVHAGSAGYAFGSFTTVPTRFSLTCSATLPSVSVTIYVKDGTMTVDNSAGVLVGGVQLEAQRYPTPYAATAATAVARNADVLSITNPLTGGLTSWCLRFSAKPGTGHSWASGQSHTFLSSGAYGTANSFSVTHEASGGLTFEIYDTNGNPRWVSTTPFTDSSPHEIAACVGNGTPYLVIDGVQATGVVGGSGTAIIAQPQALLHIGSSGGTTNWLDGAIRDIQVCDRPTAACTPPAASSTTLAYFPFDRSGGFDVDANTVAYVTWSGTALVDPYAVTTPWTMNGTVPQNVASPFYPQGFAGPQLKGAGPFSSTNYYSLPPSRWNHSEFMMCAAFRCPVTISNWPAIVSASDNATNGWQVYANGGPAINVQIFAPGLITMPSGQSCGAGPNVVCVGRAGTTQYIKLNLAATQALATPNYVPATATPRIGYSAIGYGWPNYIDAVWYAPTPWSEAAATRQIQKFLGLLGTKNETVTVTRTTTGTVTTPDARISLWPAGVARVGCDGASSSTCGLLVEPTRTNLLTYSQTFDPITWTPQNITTTVVAGGGPGGFVTDAERLTASAAAVAKIYQQYAVAATQTFTFSVWIKAGTQGTAASIQIQKDGSGGTCVNLAPTATWTRYTVTDTQTYTTFAYPQVFVNANCGSGTATVGDNILVAAPQLEVGAYASSYIPTTTTSAARNADQITATNPFAASPPAAWCVDGTYAPESGHSWVSPSGVGYLFTAGTGVAANNFKIYGDVGLYTEVRDASAAWRQLTSSLSLAAGTAHRVGLSYPGALSVTSVHIDGSPAVGTLSGAGTGTLSAQPATLTIAANGGASGNEFGGFVRNFRLCNSLCQICR